MKIANAPIPGFIIGSTILINVFSSLHPSILADSRSSFGTECENCFIRNTPKGHPTAGNTRALYVSIHPSSVINFKSGISITCFGSAIAATNTINIIPAPGNFFFAKA